MILLTGASQLCQAQTWDEVPYQLRSWGIVEGLPGNHVSAVAQDNDGFLWLATMAGLVRFDGVDFRVYNERNGQLPTGRFNAVDVGPSGRLWIGSEQGHLILREHGRFRVVEPPRYPGIHVSSIAEAADGSVWFIQGASSLGVEHTTIQHWTGSGARLRKDIEAQLIPYPRARDYDAVDKPGGPITLENRFPQIVFARDASGAVWARAWAGSSLRVADGLNDPFGPGDTTVLMLGSAKLMARRQGEQVDLVDLDSGQRVASLPRDPDRLRGVWLRDQRGHVWVTEATSLHVYGADSTTPLASWQLNSQVLDLDQDAEGNIWVATRTRGLLRIAPNPVRQLGLAQDFPMPRGLWPEADGSAQMSAQLLQPDGVTGARNHVYRITPEAELPIREPPVWRLRDRQGTQWRYSTRDLRGTRRNGSSAVLDRYCAALHLDPRHDDILWAQGETQLMRIQLFDDRDPEVTGEWPASIRSLPDFDTEGALWIGSTDGLLHIDAEQYRRFDRNDGLPINEVRALYRETDGGLWIGTYGGGLVHYDGRRFLTIDQSNGLHENFVSSIVADRFGALWLGGNRGIQRVLLSDLRAILDGSSRTLSSRLYDHAQGLDNPESVGSFSGTAVGERLYFATFGGLAVIDPGIEAARERFLPQVHLLDPSAELPMTATSTLTLDQERRHLELPFTALHLSAPETLRFRHRLEGYDSDWIDAGARRRLNYNNLPPGSYQLRLQARHSGGPWVDAGALPRVEVIPLWWETSLAWVLGAGMILALLAASWMLASRRIRQRALALEALVDERTAALQTERDQVRRQATRLKELAEGRARFMSGISHELRTPLSLILAPLKDLGDGRHGELPVAAKAQIAGAHRNSQRLMRLVERLLEVARVEAGVQTLHCLKTDLRAVVKELVEQLQPLAQQRGSELEARLPEHAVAAWVDPLLMESVLVNLIVNGLRHTPVGSHVRIELEDSPEGDDGVMRLRVRDNGPGIPADALPHLFERFFRVRGEQASGADGFGLGLPLVHEVIERHRGRIDVESSSAGTCFLLELRAGRSHLQPGDIATASLSDRRQAAMLSALAGADAEQQPLEPQREVDAAQDARQVLVVDDNAELRRLLRSYLQPEFRVLEADDGARALEQVSRTLPDLIITDVMMPVMDGYELCRTLRDDPETSFIPLLMLTAKAGLDYRVEGLEGGADAYLSKPFDRREFMANVHALLAARERLRRYYLHKNISAEGTEGPPDGAEEEPETDPVTSKFATRLLNVIDAHLADESFDIESLARAMNQDRSSLYRNVKAQFDLTPSELLRQARLKRAEALLQRDEGNVSEVAYAVGFRNVSHFSTSFRQHFGSTPSTFRRQSAGQRP